MSTVPDPSRSLDYQLGRVPNAANKVRLRVRKDAERGQDAALSELWPLDDGALRAEDLNSLYEWFDAHTEGVRSVGVEFIDGSGKYLCSATINGAGILESVAAPVVDGQARRSEDAAEFNAISTRELVRMSMEQARESSAALVTVVREVNATNARLSGHVVQLGGDNSERSESMLMLFFSELVAAKDDARASAVGRAQDKQPGEAESDTVRLVREFKDVWLTSQQRGLSGFIAALVKGDEKAAATLKGSVAGLTVEQKSGILALLAE